MTRQWYCRGTELLDDIAGCRTGERQVAAWYIGQVGFIFKQGDMTVAVDPVLNDLIGGDGRSMRLYPAPFLPGELRVDYVLCTHGHGDHMAIPTLVGIAAASPETRFIVPAACRDELLAAGINGDSVLGMNAGETITLPGLTLRAAQAAHPVHQTDAEGRDLALCYSLDMGGVVLLHLGDTYLTERLLSELSALPRPDAIFTPINGSDYFRTAGNCIGNLNPLEAARLSVMLGAGLCVPTHFDMVRGNTCSPWPYMEHLWEENPAAAAKIPAPGERFMIKRRRKV